MLPTMRALVQNEYGDLSTFSLSDVPVPTPSDGQVLIRVHAAALNPIDLKRSYMGLTGETFPIVAGYDVAGVVETSKSPDWTSGDRVFANVVGGGPKTTGAVAEYCVCRASLLGRVPETASFVQCAALPIAVGTSVQAFEEAGLKRGDKVFVSAGAGGVGVHAMQVAKELFGASEVATTASETKIEFVKKYGADRVVNYKKENAGEVLKGWADVALDCSGDYDMQKAIVKEGGKHVTIVAHDKPDAHFIMLRTSGKMMERLAELVASGKLKVVIDTEYALDEAMKALEHVAGGRAKGKVIVKVLGE